MALHVLVVFATCLALCSVLGAIVGFVVRRLSNDCSKAQHARDISLGLGIWLFVFTAILTTHVLYLTLEDLAFGQPAASLPLAFTIFIAAALGIAGSLVASRFPWDCPLSSGKRIPSTAC